MEIPLRRFLILFTFSSCLYLNAGFVWSLCLEDQHSSLLKLKQTLIFDVALSSKLVSWDSSTDCCSWPGVTCSSSGHVIGLDLSEESISGGIDNSSSLFNLHHLQSLNLAWNSFNGTRIPSGLGKLVNLRHLNLSNSEFTGQIPAEISGLTRLVSLDFSIQGSFSILGLYEHPWVLKLEDPNMSMLVRNLGRLTELHLQGADLSAEGHNWCRALSSLPRLRVLNLVECFLSGPIDSSLAKLRSLSVIRLSGNNISAPVPEFLGNFSNLTLLDLEKCGLRGNFSTKVFQLPTLQSLDISDNPLLQGSLPEFPENGSLRTLLLSSTNFSGIIPDSIGKLKGLSRMDLSYCNFKGSIPNSIGSLTNLVVLELHWNLFSGSIPSSFSMLKNLTDLNLSNNNLSGQISSIHWENLSHLVNLEFHNNSLEGIIPSPLFSLPSLQVMDLSNNRFSGQIGDFPVVHSSQLLELDLSCNRLEGPIPSSFFKLQDLQQLSLSYNNFSGTLELSIIQNLGNLSMLGLAFNDLVVDDGFGNIDLTRFPQLEILQLPSCKLRKFPSFLRNQSELMGLDFSDNLIQGEIPNWICNLPLYYLNLSHNLLTKTEGSFRNNSLVEYLDLRSNQLQGDISNMAREAYYIDYSENQFNSVIPVDIGSLLHRTSMFMASGNYLHGVIPESICNMHSLEVLDLCSNSLSGTVPWCLINITQSGSFSVLNLRRNNLVGTIPDAFSGHCGLQTLNLNENSLQGKIPRSLANCKMLEILDIGNNGINDSFPCWLSTISTLQVLVLRSNKFYGSIECPMSNGTLPLLQIVDLASNKFSGKLPKKLFETSTGMLVSKYETQASFAYHYFDLYVGQLYYLDVVVVSNKGNQFELVKILTIFIAMDFSCNNFEGKIPEVIGELKALVVLNLSHNSLTGPIPPSLGNLQHLESLDLSTNNLSGNIPPQLGGLNFLEVLNLSHNQLEGRIPKGNQFQTFSEDSFKDNKGLCGTPLMDCGANMQPPSEGKKSDTGTKIDWNLISVEVGFVFGLAIVILPLMFWKRWRIWYYKRVDSVLFRIFPQLNQRSRNHGQRALRTPRRRN